MLCALRSKHINVEAHTEATLSKVVTPTALASNLCRNFVSSTPQSLLLKPCQSGEGHLLLKREIGEDQFRDIISGLSDDDQHVIQPVIEPGRFDTITLNTDAKPTSSGFFAILPSIDGVFYGPCFFPESHSTSFNTSTRFGNCSLLRCASEMLYCPSQSIFNHAPTLAYTSSFSIRKSLVFEGLAFVSVSSPVANQSEVEVLLESLLSSAVNRQDFLRSNGSAVDGSGPTRHRTRPQDPHPSTSEKYCIPRTDKSFEEQPPRFVAMSSARAKSCKSRKVSGFLLSFANIGEYWRYCWSFESWNSSFAKDSQS